jgi:hypothetical protein
MRDSTKGGGAEFEGLAFEARIAHSEDGIVVR